ncbi:polysaccharide pyruvyl transferase family protein [Tetragenococcus halophilus]|uniref:polysaccharide pyruvyl transferase family protein n=1 Tax=Tetragenococcus halophilus TaxID=51669 RepID=UPI000B929427|nr:polysaccharide pyruvyl transferase family protein [Tetragenococcus halophilus]GFK23623.1 hypothetical protein YA163_06860 [Tetragenococcus halophilus]
MTKMKMYYAELPNMGDLLNILLMKEYFQIPVKRKTPLTANISGIGSGLGHFTFSHDSSLLKAVEYALGKRFPTVHVWGTGFIENKEWSNFYRNNMIFDAVRGQLTKNKVEDILGHKINTTLGDGGILAPLLVEKGIEKNKKYNVGIIPHFKEQNEPVFKKISDKFTNAKIINLRDEPHQVIREIAQSEIVISSSLHGLIVADAFLVPNYHIVVTDNLLGDGFKFDDYYSAYGLSHIYSSIENSCIDFLTEQSIIDNYRIKREMVNKMQENMIEAFPFSYRNSFKT